MAPVPDPGATAWLLVSTALVMLMTVPGLALFYAGLTRKENVLNTLFMSLIAYAIVSILWVLYGYELSFGETLSGLIGFPRALLLGGMRVGDLASNPPIPYMLYVAYQLTFAAITVALISGAIVERLKFSAWLAFIPLWLTLVYAPVAHWVWGGGFLGELGILDFAGGLVVHINSGAAALALAYLVGRRRELHPPHHLGYTVLGAGLLWFGWFGFNAGSALAASDLAASALLATNTAAATGMISWSLVDYLRSGKPTVLGGVSGAVAGLVAITPAAGYVPIYAAVIIGLVTGLLSYLAVTYLKPRLGCDDAFDVFGIHGVSGLWGSLATGIFASPLVNEAGIGLLYGNPEQLVTQVMASALVLAYSFAVTLAIGKLLDVFIGLRVPEDVEKEGLDIKLHGEEGYRI